MDHVAGLKVLSLFEGFAYYSAAVPMSLALLALLVVDVPVPFFAVVAVAAEEGMTDDVVVAAEEDKIAGFDAND